MDFTSYKKLLSILYNIRTQYDFVKKIEFEPGVEDLVLQKIKIVESLINKLDLSSIDKEDYDELLIIKKDIFKIKKEIIGSVKSKKYGPLLKSSLEVLLKKYKIIFNNYPYDDTIQQEKFNELIDFLDLPKVIDFYEGVIKRVINQTITERAFRSFIESVQSAMKNESLVLGESYQSINNFVYSINESYESQQNIELFVDDILETISDSLFKMVQEREENTILISYMDLDFSKYPEIEKYIHNIEGQGIYVCPKSKLSDSLKNKTHGYFSRKNGNIFVFFPVDYLINEFDVNKIKKEQIALLLYDDSLSGISTKDVLIHEIQHAFDFWRSNGKSYNTKEYNKYLKDLTKNKSEEIKSVSQDKVLYNDYLNLPHEISARFTETMSIMKVHERGEIIPLRLFLEDFKNKFYGWSKVSDIIQKSLLRKCSNFWYKMIDTFKNNESITMKKTTIKSLEEFLKLNEDFYNPFDEEDLDTKKQSTKIVDHGGFFSKQKLTYNLNKVEWSKTGQNKFTALAKTNFAKGEIIEICPVILVPEITKTIDTIRDFIFEINAEREEYGLVLGYGSLYGHSDKANVEYAYNKGKKLMYLIARTHIKDHEELTINYGTNYWNERNSLNTIKNIESIIKPVEESEIQPNAADIENGQIAAEFSQPNNINNPVMSGVAIQGVGQS